MSLRVLLPPEPVPEGPPAAAEPAPTVLSMAQPEPVSTLYCAIPCGTMQRTAIARTWRPGDVARCRLCPVCSAFDDQCLIVASREVSADEAPMYESSAWSRPSPFAR